MGSTKPPRGCPQGSTLVPLLWNIFQNDQTYVVKNSKLNMYADDHQLYTISKSVLESESVTLNKEEDNISRWNEENLQKCNFDKYQAMSMGPPGKNKQLNVEIQGTSVESLTELVLLGVTIDKQLNFKTHIGTVCKKPVNKLGLDAFTKNYTYTRQTTK